MYFGFFFFQKEFWSVYDNVKFLKNICEKNCFMINNVMGFLLLDIIFDVMDFVNVKMIVLFEYNNLCLILYYY